MSEVDTAAIRAAHRSAPCKWCAAGAEHGLSVCIPMALCDALDAAQAEIESRSYYHDSDLRGLLDALAARDAVLARVRAICDEAEADGPTRMPSAQRIMDGIRAALDC